MRSSYLLHVYLGRATDPNFLRFGKSAEPNFLRFGKHIEVNEPNFLRFGRNNSFQSNREYNERFNRQDRKPNFLRFVSAASNDPPGVKRCLKWSKPLTVPIATHSIIKPFTKLNDEIAVKGCRLEGMYVYLLPFAIRKQLAAILDTDNAWELLAFVMPDIGNADVRACREAGFFESPTENLLAIWGSKGNKIIQLYNCLGRVKLNSDGITRYFEEASLLKYFSNVRWLDAKTNNRTESDMIYKTLQNTPCIKYEDIVSITNSFSSSNILGSGGYGTVYRGIWEQTEVAVKCIQATNEYGAEVIFSKEQLRQSLQELKTLSKYRHDNILPLYAYSLDGPQPCLLYQYMANGSLFDCLFKKKHMVLTWFQRISIMIGCARALHYLHSVAENPIIHGDVKSANILLDKYLEPKLGDFGLCRDNFSKEDWKNDGFVIASHIKGTLAYLPEEFLTKRIVSTKLDVYSYGVVLLEVATGLKPHVMRRNPQNIVEYVMDHGRCGKPENILADRHCNFTNVSYEKVVTVVGWLSWYFDLGLKQHSDSVVTIIFIKFIVMDFETSEQNASNCLEMRMTEDELREGTPTAFCEICSRTFANKNAFHLHQVKTHNLVRGEADSALFHRKRVASEAERHYFCPIANCRYNSGRFFNAYKLLRQHFLKVHGERRFRCDTCKIARFSLQRDLLYHQRKRCPLKEGMLSSSFLCHSSKSPTLARVKSNYLEAEGKKSLTKNHDQNVVCAASENKTTNIIISLNVVQASRTPSFREIYPKPNAIYIDLIVILQSASITVRSNFFGFYCKGSAFRATKSSQTDHVKYCDRSVMCHAGSQTMQCSTCELSTPVLHEYNDFHCQTHIASGVEFGTQIYPGDVVGNGLNIKHSKTHSDFEFEDIWRHIETQTSTFSGNDALTQTAIDFMDSASMTDWDLLI
uniref:Protein kinase domain-containing protein n=1 Tax=Setaria digitata TaxID=48799 RepID=A0A915PC98_9BILA